MTTFIQNKYTKYYYGIIENARSRENTLYTEKHHIIPKSLGGDNNINNIVKLSAREHFICHRLLCKMTTDTEKAKMSYAAWQQGRSLHLKGIKISSRLYEQLKINLSKSMTGRKRKPFSAEWRENISKGHMGEKNYSYGKPRSAELKQKISESRKGKCMGEDNPFYGKTHSPETLAIMGKASSERHKGIPKKKYKCPYCGGMFAPNIMKRFHDVKCKKYQANSL